MNLKAILTTTTFHNPKFFDTTPSFLHLPPPPRTLPQKHHVTNHLLDSSTTSSRNRYSVIVTCLHNRASDDNVDASVSTDNSNIESIWSQIVEIVSFSGPATGLWICGPLMSLIDTVVIGQSSSLQLAALGNYFTLLVL